MYFEGYVTIIADDNTIDNIDCGVYASPTDSAHDSDSVYADRVSEGIRSATSPLTAKRFIRLGLALS